MRNKIKENDNVEDHYNVDVQGALNAIGVICFTVNIEIFAERLPQLIIQAIAFAYQLDPKYISYIISTPDQFKTSCNVSNISATTTAKYTDAATKLMPVVSMLISLITSIYVCTCAIMNRADFVRKTHLKEKIKEIIMSRQNLRDFKENLSTRKYFKLNYTLLISVFMFSTLFITIRIVFILIHLLFLYLLPIHVLFKVLILIGANLIRVGIVSMDKDQQEKNKTKDPVNRVYTFFLNLFYYPMDYYRLLDLKQGMLYFIQFFVDICLAIALLLINYYIVNTLNTILFFVYVLAMLFMAFLIKMCIQVAIANMFELLKEQTPTEQC